MHNGIKSLNDQIRKGEEQNQTPGSCFELFKRRINHNSHQKKQNRDNRPCKCETDKLMLSVKKNHSLTNGKNQHLRFIKIVAWVQIPLNIFIWFGFFQAVAVNFQVLVSRTSIGKFNFSILKNKVLNFPLVVDL